MHKKAILILLSFALFVFSEKTADAAALLSVEQSDLIVNVNKGFYYDSGADSMKLDFYGTRVESGDIQFYHDAGLTSVGTFKEFKASTNGWLKSVQFTCSGWYVAKIYYRDGSQAAKVTVRVDDGDLKSDRCNSEYDGPDEDEIEETLCKSKICECIADLKAPLDDIKQSVDGVKDSVDGVKESVDKSTSELVKLNETTSEIKEVLTDFADEFKTSIDYTVDPMPDVSDLLDKNKPEQNETPFVDDNIYFKDEGDADDADPGKLPKAPDIKDWDGFKPEFPMPPEDELKKESELKKENELKKDKENQVEPEMKPDIIDRQPEMKPDIIDRQPEMKPDIIDREPEMKPDIIDRQPEMKPDIIERDPEFNQTNKFEQTNKFSEGD